MIQVPIFWCVNYLTLMNEVFVDIIDWYLTARFWWMNSGLRLDVLSVFLLIVNSLPQCSYKFDTCNYIATYSYMFMIKWVFVLKNKSSEEC